MKLQNLKRSAAAASVLALSLSLAACGSDDDSSADDSAGDTSSQATDSGAGTEGDTESEATGGDQFANVFGPACGEVPTTGAGSLDGMVNDPVATAASNNPLLETLVAAVGAVEGLPGTLNDAEALTVFAPYNEAFGAIPEDQLNGLLEGAKADGANSDLAKILSHHVVGANLAPTDVTGEQDTLNGDTLTISGDPESGMMVSDGTVEAQVLCGGVPTANATVYVIDSVLTGLGS